MPANPDDVLDSMSDDQYEKDKFLPYWAQQWPASLSLFNFIASASNAEFFASGPDFICELGAGLGIVSSLLCTKKKFVVATDIAPDACKYSAYNIGLYSRPAMVVCSDWREAPFKIKFDCIVGSDIIYERRWISPVLEFLVSFLRKDGAAFIADPCRQWWSEFQDTAASKGFSVTRVWREIVNQGKTTAEIVRLTCSP
jgi:predicted nicotinamide N-methyase